VQAPPAILRWTGDLRNHRLSPTELAKEASSKIYGGGPRSRLRVVEPWPSTASELIAEQEALASLTPSAYGPPARPVIGACWICFPRGLEGKGGPDDPAWAAAVVLDGKKTVARTDAIGAAGAPYEAGLLALREGPLLEQVVRSLPVAPDVLLVNATGRDHPRRAGLALHLGAVLDLATVGVTHRPLVATGPEPGPARGDLSPIVLDDEVVGALLRTREGRRCLAVHPAWRTDLDVSLQVVMLAVRRARTPEPLRRARHFARLARAWSPS
jgi:deoxyribonuclease V